MVVRGSWIFSPMRRRRGADERGARSGLWSPLFSCPAPWTEPSSRRFRQTAVRRSGRRCRRLAVGVRRQAGVARPAVGVRWAPSRLAVCRQLLLPCTVGLRLQTTTRTTTSLSVWLPLESLETCLFVAQNQALTAESNTHESRVIQSLNYSTRRRTARVAAIFVSSPNQPEILPLPRHDSASTLPRHRGRLIHTITARPYARKPV